VIDISPYLGFLEDRLLHGLEIQAFLDPSGVLMYFDGDSTKEDMEILHFI